MRSIRPRPRADRGPGRDGRRARNASRRMCPLGSRSSYTPRREPAESLSAARQSRMMKAAAGCRAFTSGRESGCQSASSGHTSQGDPSPEPASRSRRSRSCTPVRLILEEPVSGRSRSSGLTAGRSKECGWCPGRFNARTRACRSRCRRIWSERLTVTTDAKGRGDDPVSFPGYEHPDRLRVDGPGIARHTLPLRNNRATTITVRAGPARTAGWFRAE